MMLILMKMLYLYPLEVYNFELRFSQNSIQNGCISLSFLAAGRMTLSPFPQTRSEALFRATYSRYHQANFPFSLFHLLQH